VIRWSVTNRVRLFAVTGILLLAKPGSAADVELRTGCVAHFASEIEAAQILGQKDDFIDRLSPFDRAARLKTDQPVSEEKFLAFIKTCVRPWTDAEEIKLQGAIAAIRSALEKVSLKFPSKISFIKTNGAEEGRAFYTRDTAIIMPAGEVEQASSELLRKTIAHELFHILSRTNPDFREKLYQTIGFSKCDEIQLPPELAIRKITNPDAPRNDHAIRLHFGGKEVAATPILLATSEKYDRTRGGEFFNYLQLKFLLPPKSGAGKPEVIDPAYVSDLFEQVGHNTEYIIHPEEILADNFALLMIGTTNLKSPEILEKIRSLVEQKF
jgi:hypothetical protein